MKPDKIQNNIEEEVLKRIECGDVKMKSRRYFVVKAAILVFFTFVIFVSTTILVSFLVFTLVNRGDLFLLSFGAKGISKFVLMFPWYLLVINAFLLIFLDYLVRRFKYGYHSPIIYLFLGTLVFVTLFSFVINYTSFHKMLYGFARKNNIPYADQFYNNIRMPHRQDGVARGIVTYVGDNYLVLRPTDRQNMGEQIKVYAPEGMDIKNLVHVGEEVYIAGDIATGTEIIPYGMHRMSMPVR